MPLYNRKTYRAPRSVYVKQGASQTRIKIPQPVERPLQIRRRIVRMEYMRPQMTWFTLHHRAPVHKPGDDPLEMRAVPKTSIKGTLPERIVYKALMSIFHMVPGADFTFQSSLSGGRLEVGGLVADFIFPKQKIILQVQGPTHTSFMREAKDREQRNILAEYGYTVEYLGLEEIYNEVWLENKLRMMLGYAQGSGAGTGTVYGAFSNDIVYNIDELYAMALHVKDNLVVISGVT